MLTEARTGAGPAALRIKAGTLAALAVGAAVLTSTVVFSEPAPTDVFMAGVIVAVPLLGVGRLGAVTAMNLALWLAIVALGFFALALPDVPETGLKHQVVTLFLALGSVAIAAYVARDPEPRFNLIMVLYTVACLAASAAALAGYFKLVPGTHELFTNYGRARGTFKDPNVYGAALIPALTFLAWHMLRGSPRIAQAAAVALVPLVLGLLLSFSRGAWVSAALALLIVGWAAFVTSRRKRDWKRLTTAVTVGVAGLVVVLAGASQLEQVRALLEQRATMDQSYDQGPEGRFGGQEKAVALALENPFGIGTHTFRTHYHAEEPHNVFLSMFLNAGWLGGLLYIGSVMITLAVGLRLALQPGVLQGPIVIAGAAFAALAFEGLIIDSDHWRHYFLLLGLVWGLADARPKFVDDAKRRDD